MKAPEPLIPKHGGYRKLKSFRVAQLVYDVTARFCDLYIDKHSRTHDQMIQAARSGVQNIAEASMASGTSKKTELKLTGVARASLEELRLDFEDFLRQRGLTPWPPDHPALRRFKGLRCATLDQVREWVETEKRLADREKPHGPTRTNTDKHGLARTSTDPHGQARGRTTVPGKAETSTPSVAVRGRPWSSVSAAERVANAALSLLNLCCHLLDRQLSAQAKAFESGGGFTERLYRVRSARRDRPGAAP